MARSWSDMVASERDVSLIGWWWGSGSRIRRVGRVVLTTAVAS